RRRASPVVWGWSGEVQNGLTGKSGDQEKCNGAQRGEFNGEGRSGNVLVHGEVLVLFFDSLLVHPVVHAPACSKT
ncbi:MAG TPA: hypothetical protein VIA80_12900, partial [Hyphomonadaceae bacterium]